MNKKWALLVGFSIFTVFFMVTWDQVINLVDLPRFRRQPSAEPTPPPWQRVSTETITPIHGSKHLMVSAFKEHRVGGAIRVISIICTKELQPLYCVLCASSEANAMSQANANSEANTKANHKFAGTVDGPPGLCKTSQAEVNVHRESFGFPCITSDVLCRGHAQATYVSLSTQPNLHNLTFLLIQNQEVREPYKYNFTLCISTLFGKFNNALQIVQAMEVYKLIGVQRIVVYNTSCGPDVDKALQHYRKEGLVEVVPWPIHKFLTPSTGWLNRISPGDIHYYGQMTTLNECIYRNMYRSKYLLLHDLDEILMPYKYPNLEKLMEALQRQHPTAGVFRIENHPFPRNQFEDSGRFRLARWSRVPGVNILDRIYREPIRRDLYNGKKLVIDPRRVEQTSVHETLKQSGPVINVPPDISLIIHTQFGNTRNYSKDNLILDKKLWEFEKYLIPRIDDTLKLSGLL